MASPPYPHHHFSHPQHPDPAFKALLGSSWRVLEQLPPPSLREILGAYNARGDGDREMLLAMLNAKSAEDQRLFAAATLQQTMLEMYRVSTLSEQPIHHYPPEPYHFPPPHIPPMTSAPMHERRLSRSSGESTSRLTPPHLPGLREPPSLASGRPRKRARSSRSSHSPQSRQLESFPTASPDLPPSPYSSSHSDSVERSPRSRGSMAIGSLLSSGAKESMRAERERDETHSERDQSRRGYDSRDEWPSQPTPIPAAPSTAALAV